MKHLLYMASFFIGLFIGTYFGNAQSNNCSNIHVSGAKNGLLRWPKGYDSLGFNVNYSLAFV